MKIVNIQQNTEEWQEFRMGKSGGSGLGKLYPAGRPTRETLIQYFKDNGLEYTLPAPTKKDPFNTKEMTIDQLLEHLTFEQIGDLKATYMDKKDAYYRLVAERLARPITPNDYKDQLGEQPFSMMTRGHLLEPEAIKEFEKRNKVQVHPTSMVWQRDDNENSIVSPDGVIGETEAVEVKCPDSHRMIRAFEEDRYPEEYAEQVVKYFIVNEKLAVLHFVLYTDVMPSLSYLQFDIYRSDIEDKIIELTAFEDSILAQAEKLAERLAF